MKKKIPFYNFQWKEIYTFPCTVTINAYNAFKYKILHNILYLNKKLNTFGSANIQLCSFCKIAEETISHLNNQAQTYFTNCFHFSELTPQTTILGFHKIVNDTFLVQNHILPLLKLHIYNARKYRFLSFNNFLNEISEIKNIEKRVARNNRSKCERFRKKWHRIENKIPYDLITNKQKKSTLYESREGGRVG